MPIEFLLDSLDTVEESLRDVYVEADGKFKLDIDKYVEKSKKPLLTKNSELLGKLKTAKGFQEIAEKFKDISEDDLQEFLEAKANKETNPNGNVNKDDTATVSKEFHERALGKEKTKLQKQIDGLSTENQSLRGQVREYSIWIPVQAQMTKAGVLPDRADALLKVLRADGRFDLNDAGKQIFKDIDGDETDMSMERAFEVLKTEFPWAFAASENGGSGASNNSRGGGAEKNTIKRNDFDKLSMTARKEFLKRDGARVVD